MWQRGDKSLASLPFAHRATLHVPLLSGDLFKNRHIEKPFARKAPGTFFQALKTKPEHKKSLHKQNQPKMNTIAKNTATERKKIRERIRVNEQFTQKRPHRQQQIKHMKRK